MSPTRPHVKNGEPPSIVGSSSRLGGRRNISTSCGRANCKGQTQSDGRIICMPTTEQRIGKLAVRQIRAAGRHRRSGPQPAQVTTAHLRDARVQLGGDHHSA